MLTQQQVKFIRSISKKHSKGYHISKIQFQAFILKMQQNPFTEIQDYLNDQIQSFVLKIRTNTEKRDVATKQLDCIQEIQEQLKYSIDFINKEHELLIYQKFFAMINHLYPQIQNLDHSHYGAQSQVLKAETSQGKIQITYIQPNCSNEEIKHNINSLLKAYGNINEYLAKVGFQLYLSEEYEEKKIDNMKGILEEIIKNKNDHNQHVKKLLAVQTLHALNDMHSKNTLHKGIELQNILIQQINRLYDVGLASDISILRKYKNLKRNIQAHFSYEVDKGFSKIYYEPKKTQSHDLFSHITGNQDLIKEQVKIVCQFKDKKQAIKYVQMEENELSQFFEQLLDSKDQNRNFEIIASGIYRIQLATKDFKIFQNIIIKMQIAENTAQIENAHFDPYSKNNKKYLVNKYSQIYKNTKTYLMCEIQKRKDFREFVNPNHKQNLLYTQRQQNKGIKLLKQEKLILTQQTIHQDNRFEKYLMQEIKYKNSFRFQKIKQNILVSAQPIKTKSKFNQKVDQYIYKQQPVQNERLKSQQKVNVQKYLSNINRDFNCIKMKLLGGSEKQKNQATQFDDHTHKKKKKNQQLQYNQNQNEDIIHYRRENDEQQNSEFCQQLENQIKNIIGLFNSICQTQKDKPQEKYIQNINGLFDSNMGICQTQQGKLQEGYNQNQNQNQNEMSKMQSEELPANTNKNKNIQEQDLYFLNSLFELGDYRTSGGEADIFFNSKKKVAFRVIKIQDDSLSRNLSELHNIKQFQEEKNVLDLQTSHFIENKSDQQKYIIHAMQICQYSLDREYIIKQEQKLDYSLSEILNIIFTCLHYLIQLRQKYIYHSDIKLANILKIKDQYKLSDFGASQIISIFNPYAIADMKTPYYSPKNETNENLPFYHDIYSVAKTLEVLLNKLSTTYVNTKNKLKQQIQELLKDDKNSIEIDCFQLPQKFINCLLIDQIEMETKQFLESYLVKIEEYLIINKENKVFQYESQFQYAQIALQILKIENSNENSYKNQIKLKALQTKCYILIKKKIYKEAFECIEEILNSKLYEPRLYYPEQHSCEHLQFIFRLKYEQITKLSSNQQNYSIQSTELLDITPYQSQEVKEQMQKILEVFNSTTINQSQKFQQNQIRYFDCNKFSLNFIGAQSYFDQKFDSFNSQISGYGILNYYLKDLEKEICLTLNFDDQSDTISYFIKEQDQNQISFEINFNPNNESNSIDRIFKIFNPKDLERFKALRPINIELQIKNL
ncbi:hypothetical protein ABPG74_006805 [Tetrahymena malaccensis]